MEISLNIQALAPLGLPLGALLGLIFGSFLCVCIHRIPRANSFYPEDDIPEEAIPEPVPFNSPQRSICTACSNQLLWWHNIPVISWLILGGKCYFCKTAISYRYPFVELFSAVLAILCYLVYGFTLTAVFAYLIAAALLVVIFIDLDHYIIPDVISKSGIAVGIATSSANHYFKFLKEPFCQTISECFWGLVLGGGFLWFVARSYQVLRKKEGLGLGDVKLLYMIGAFFGPLGALTTITIGSILGCVIGLITIILSGLKLNHYIAFGPYLVMAAYLYLFLGQDALIILIESIQRLGALLG